MLFLILSYYYLTQGATIDASPVSSIDKRSFKSNPCTDLTHCRTVWNIIWSCLITIFSCTWVAVHPNIPCPRKREAKNCIERWVWHPLLSFAEYRLPLFVYALLVPEYILAWAIRQYLRARRIANENKGELDTLDENLDMLIQSYIKDALGRKHSLLSWEVFISFSVVRKERVITQRTSLFFMNLKTIFRFIHSPIATSMATKSTSPRLPYRLKWKSRTGGRATGSLNPSSSFKRRGS